MVVFVADDLGFCGPGFRTSRQSSVRPKALLRCLAWEVLNGAGVDGVGVTFPFFDILPLFLRMFPLFLRVFPLFLLKDKGKQQPCTAKMGNFTPTLSAPTPCKTSGLAK